MPIRRTVTASWRSAGCSARTRSHARTATGPLPCQGGSPAAPMSERQFVTIAADPPWQYDNRPSRAAAEDHYRVMPIEELAGLMGRLERDGS